MARKKGETKRKKSFGKKIDEEVLEAEHERRDMVKVCPNCGYPEIEYASLRRGSVTTPRGMGLPEIYLCPRCGYQGSVILELDKKEWKRTKFKPKPPAIHLSDKRSSEVLKPVFIAVIAAFIATAFLIFLPTYSAPEVTPDNVIALGSTTVIFEVGPTQEQLIGTITDITQEAGVVKLTVETEKGTYLIYQSTLDDQILNIERAAGTVNVGGFLFPLFMVFFVLGFVVLMIYSHWGRLVHFH